MSLDTYTDHNPDNPINRPEIEAIPLTELEEQQEWNMELCQKIALMKNDLKTLKDIEEMFAMLGNLSFEEQEQKRNILNKY